MPEKRQRVSAVCRFSAAFGFGPGCVCIRFCGNGGYWFRPYGESLWKSPKVTKGLLPLSFGPSPRLRVPSLRSCSVGPPPSAIHGRGRLTRHPCRVAHYAEPPLGLSRGRLPPQPPRRPESRPGSSVVRTLAHCGGCTSSECLHIPPVGAGLLAMASVQPIHASTDSPLSPASRLLQGIGFTRLKIVGAGLPAMDVNDNAGLSE
jgi:hypothetical protein